MTLYQVYLEGSKSGCLAHILSLPGCTAFGRSEKIALRNLEMAVRKHHHWLKRHKSKQRIHQRFKFQVIQRLEGTTPWISSSAAALFLPDLIPPTRSEIREYIKLLRRSRSDLLKLIGPLSDKLLDFGIPKRWSIRRNLNHIANAEWWYLSRIAEWPEIMAIPEKVSKDKIISRMERIRAAAYRILPRLSDSRYHQIYVPAKYCDKSLKEPWTARKVLRRFVEHEREHYFNIQDLLKETKKVTQL